MNPVVSALAQCVDTGLLIVDDGVVAVANQEFRRLFDLADDPRDDPRDDSLGDPLEHPLGDPLVGARLADLVEREPFRAVPELWEIGERRRRLRLPGGRVVEGRWHVLPSDGAPLLVAVIGDLTKETLVRDRLRRHNRALAEVVATKTELVSAMLHELRTPLAAALAMVDLLPESSGDPLVDEAMALISRQVRRIGEVAAEIATISGIENGTVPLELTSFDLPSLLAGTGAAVRATPGAGIVTGDRPRLESVFRRLVAAVRALGGSDEMVAGLDGDRWRIALPLPSGRSTDRLFTTGGSGGNATALMLARAVVGRHGGSVGVESVSGTPHLLVRLPADGPG